jgi:hypothetical protein
MFISEMLENTEKGQEGQFHLPDQIMVNVLGYLFFL